MGFRDIKRKARRDLHRTLQVPALYFDPKDPASVAAPLPITIRIHSAMEPLGDMQGTSLAFAERVETIPRVIFMLADLPEAASGCVFSVQPGEAYKVKQLDPTDDITQTARCTRMRDTDCCDYPVPVP